MTDTQELAVSNESIEVQQIQQIIGGEPSLLFKKPDLLDPLVSHIEKEIKEFDYDLSTDTSRRAVISFANKINKTRVGIDKAGKEINQELAKKRDANNAFIARAAERINGLRDKAKKPLTDWEAAEAEKDDRRQKTLAEIKILGNSGLDDTSDQIADRLKTLKAMDLDAMDMGDFLDAAKERRDYSISSLNSSYLRVKEHEDKAAELLRLKAKQKEDDRIREEELKELEALRAEKAKRKAEEEAANADPVAEVKDSAPEPERTAKVAVGQHQATYAPEAQETAPANSQIDPADTSPTEFEVGDPDEDTEEAQDPRLTKIIAVLCARGELEMFDAIRIGEMLFKGEVPHMELV
ncbi:hypothetical protein [Maritalea porphyrae]|uniref:hypothetical protein n=1 Tax=Maritalea porphyrae TaxID=880732 RepID=UPI0022AF6E61|nr:hypothetical protein [Maritalea porphyrae]MCZ4270768.1 hypothetical protein [Maritalea porphyrae]